MNRESIKQNRRRWNQREKQKNSWGKRKNNSRKNNKRKKKKQRNILIGENNWKDKKKNKEKQKKKDDLKIPIQWVKDISVYRHAYRSAGKKGLGTRAIYDRNSELRRAEMYTVITIREVEMHQLPVCGWQSLLRKTMQLFTVQACSTLKKLFAYLV